MLPQAFVEPQRTYEDGTWRVLAGARSFIFGHPWKAYGRPLRMHLLAEGFGLLGEDGRGVGVGAGVGYRGIVSLAYRRVWTDQGQRQSVTLDVHLFGAPHYAKGRKTWQNHSKHLLSELRESERIRAACFSEELPYGLPPNPPGHDPRLDPLTPSPTAPQTQPESDGTVEESSPE